MGNGIFRRTILGTVLALCVGSAGAANAATGKRVQISGEIVDS
jgi:hypothetical protein